MSNGMRAVVLVLAAAVILVCVYSCNGKRHRNDMYVTGVQTTEEVSSAVEPGTTASFAESVANVVSKYNAAQGGINITAEPTEEPVRTTAKATQDSNGDTTRVRYTYDENVFLSSVSGDFRYSVSGMDVSIVSYLGDGGAVSVPEKINGRTVTAIGPAAFSGAGGGGGSKITSVTLPSTVTSIEKKAFASCASLTSVTVPASVTNIGQYAFENCPLLVINCQPNTTASLYAQENAITASYY